MAELNNEFDVKVRAQKHFEESVAKKSRKSSSIK